MQISARNQLKGTARSVKLGTIMSEVTVDVGGQEIVAAITRGSAEGLGLHERLRGDRHHQGHGGDDRDRLVRLAGAPSVGHGLPS
jgi:molybdopterin-binding protein